MFCDDGDDDDVVQLPFLWTLMFLIHAILCVFIYTCYESGIFIAYLVEIYM
jgi:hypothetical protein